MLNKIKEKHKKSQFENLLNLYEENKKVYDCNNEYFLNHLLSNMKGRMVQVSYQFGIVSMKKEINGEQIIMEYPLIKIEDWTISLKTTRCSVETLKEETLLIIKTDWATPTPDQKLIISF